MGGFRVNGCGVTEHFKKIKKLGTHICPSCQKLAEFTLDEVNKKIDIVYIPTFTLKSNYAVMCSRCKTGEFCSVDWAGYLLNHDDVGEAFFESTAKEKGWVPGGLLPAAAPSQPVPPRNASAVALRPAAQQTEAMPPARAVPIQMSGTATASSGYTCHVCGARMSANMLFCTECGTKLRRP